MTTDKRYRIVAGLDLEVRVRLLNAGDEDAVQDRLAEARSAVLRCIEDALRDVEGRCATDAVEIDWGRARYLPDAVQEVEEYGSGSPWRDEQEYLRDRYDDGPPDTDDYVRDESPLDWLEGD